MLACIASSSIAVAADKPWTGQTVESAAECTALCQPSLIRRSDGKLVAIWSASDGQTWAQTIDPQQAGLLGPAVDLGVLAAGKGRVAEQPLVVALPAGDLALVGLLAQGGVVFARGSLSSERRVAPKIAIPAAAGEVLGLAAAPSGDGFAVLVLRAPAGFVSSDGRAPEKMSVELHSLGSKGDQQQPTTPWQAPAGFAPRLAECNETLFLTWQHADDLITTVIGPDRVRAAERRLAPGKRVLSDLGPLFCEGGDARLLTSWRRSLTADEDLSELGWADLPAAASSKPRWQTIKLPGPPSMGFGGSLAASLNEGKAELWLEKLGVLRLMKLDVQTRKLEETAVRLPGARECLPVARDAGAVCVSRVAGPRGPCPNQPARVAVGFFGELPKQAAQPAETFWAPAKLKIAEAPSPSSRPDPSRLRCGEDGWSTLRDALASWCASKGKRAASGELMVFCSAEYTESLLYQAKNCTTLPAGCKPPKDAAVPSVDRAEFDKGEWIDFSYANCSAYFTRDQGKVRVVNGECEGD